MYTTGGTVRGGGGGGADAPGIAGNADVSIRGFGGSGRLSDITGTSTYYAGGGYGVSWNFGRPTAYVPITFVRNGTSVTAYYGENNGGTKTQSASYNLFITSLHINLGTDPTAELATQPIFLDLSVYDVTDSQWRFFGSLAIGNGDQQIVLPTPILIVAASVALVKVVTTSYQARNIIALSGRYTPN
jgi:hypothetical protein